MKNIFSKNLKLFLTILFINCFFVFTINNANAYEPFSFIIFGDDQENNSTSLADAKSKYPNLSFAAHTGDSYSSQMKTSLDTVFGSNFPFFMSPGNHNIDTPSDLDYDITNFYPNFSTRLAGISDFNSTLPSGSVTRTVFDMFNKSGVDKRVTIVNHLVTAGLGHPDNSESTVDLTTFLSSTYFIWNNPSMTLNDFIAVLDEIDFSDSLLTDSAFNTVAEIKNGIKMAYLNNKFVPFSFNYRGAHFIFLNTYYDDDGFASGRISPRLLAWLQADLEANTDNKPVFAFGHEPAYPWGNRHWPATLPNKDLFFQLLRDHNGMAYFSGHTHFYGRSLHEGVYDVGVGAIGSANNELGRRTYMIVSMKDGNINLETYTSEYGEGDNTFNLTDNWSINSAQRDAFWRTVTPGPGGWVTALAIDPNNSNRVLAGGDMFGIAVSNDGGLTWSNSYGTEMYEIESFLMPKSSYGETLFYQFAATIGGLYESYDGGYDWAEKTGGEWPSLSTEVVSRPVSALARASYIYAGTGSVRMQNASVQDSTMGMIYKLNMFSDTQALTEMFDFKTVTGGEANIQHIIAQSRGANPDRLFVSLRDGGVWRSDDGGTTWVDTNLPAANAYTMADDASNQDVLYVAAGGNGIYKTTDAGITWSNLSVDVDTQTIATALTNGNIIYVGSYSGPNRGVMKSTDAGATWQKVLNGYNLPTLSNTHGSTNIKYHALAIDPKNANHVIVGDDVNLYVTFDGGVNWQSSGGATTDNGQTWSSTNFNGVCGEFTAFDLQNPSHFITGGADGALWQTWDNGQTFNRPVTDVFDPSSPGEIFNDFQDGVISRQDSNTIYIVSDLHTDEYEDSGPLFKTINGGSSWIKVNDGPFESVRIKNDNDQIVLAIGSGRIQRSIDGGITFVDVSTDIDAVRLSSDPVNNAIFYSTASSGVYRSSDSGLTWTKIGDMNVWGNFGKVAVDPINPENLYATTFGGFWKYNGGIWTKIKTVDYASDITITKDGIIYGSATSFNVHDRDPITTGIWKSDDSGSNWYLFNQGLRSKRVSTIESNPITGRVIAGVDGGGFALFDYSLNTGDAVVPNAPTNLSVL